ncbi:hypothetical protein RO3G_11212 [Lichtheimia corymbifera JMRC:FSU:9682]|uniref:F-box domain-containing protein n=1 Tax=Lichtheimia corymbifera JMRC:FSU:9682 TaxID=1263082 RepID=A0A068RZV2_9FUNG|nr:hypothetical protein RO3G_11212 [Lichtheimia corymbifera JMRC:FSU:9682]
MVSLLDLPPEILWHIISSFDHNDLSIVRLSCKKLRHFCDHPSHWRTLSLKPSPTTNSKGGENSMDLWQLHELERLIGPHVAHIQTIQIWGVRDHVVRYLLTHCTQLLDLTVCGWTTLSNHAFNPKKTMRLRRLELIGAVQQPNYAALGCQIHIHARTLLKELKKAPTSSSPPPAQKLTSLTLATRRTWSQRHVAELMERCPALVRVYLLPAAAKGFDLKKDHQEQWSMTDKRQVSVEPSSDSEDDHDADLTMDMVVLRSNFPNPHTVA